MLKLHLRVIQDTNAKEQFPHFNGFLLIFYLIRSPTMWHESLKKIPLIRVIRLALDGEATLGLESLASWCSGAAALSTQTLKVKLILDTLLEVCSVC